MKQTVRLVALVLSAQALTATVAATAAYAHPGHVVLRPGQTPGSHGNPHAGGAQQLRALDRLDRRLTGATKDSRVGRLDDADATALVTNAATDKTTLATAAAALTADPSDVNVAAADALLGSYTAKPYVVGVNLLRHSERLGKDIATLQATVTPGSDEAAGLAEATGLLAGVPASGFTAATDDSALRTDQRAVAQAQALVGQIADGLAGS